jgi:hypothetical protein
MWRLIRIRGRLGDAAFAVLVMMFGILAGCDSYSISQPRGVATIGAHRVRHLENNRHLSPDEIARILQSPMLNSTAWSLSPRQGGAAFDLGASHPAAYDFFELNSPTDTLIGALDIAMRYQSDPDMASVAGSARATQHRGPATVQSIAEITIGVGFDTPHEAGNDCHGQFPDFNFCSWGDAYDVDCHIDGSAIQAHVTDNVAYPTGPPYTGEIDSDDSCNPPPGGGGGGSGPPTDCGSYIVEISWDGGATWNYLGSFSDC